MKNRMVAMMFRGMTFWFGAIFTWIAPPSHAAETNAPILGALVPGRTVADVIKIVEDSGFEAVILRGDNPDRVVIVTPDLLGRVLATGFEGVAGPTDSYVIEENIRKGLTKSGRGGDWANYGGEERIWIAPEGGEYGFYWDTREQGNKNYLVPEDLNSKSYKIIELPAGSRSVTFEAPVNLTNLKGNKFELNVRRRIEALSSCLFTLGYGDAVESVGFESRTWVRNDGERAFDQEYGAVGAWTLGQFRDYPRSIVILPFRKGPDSELGEPVSTQYYKTEMIDTTWHPEGVPFENYMSVEDGCALIKANGHVQTKIEMRPKRSLGRFASINLDDFSLNVVEFMVYPEMDYVASDFLPYEGDPYKGSAISVFALADRWGAAPFHEMECLSPALYLQPNEQFCHISRTWRLRGPRDAMLAICKKFFNVDYETLVEFDKRTP